MSSSGKHLRLSTQTIVVSMFLNVLLGDVEERMDKMFGDTWTLVMQSRPVVYVNMQKNVGVMQLWKLQM
jgi:hypothetical protein